MFVLFIQALGARLEEMVQEDKQHVANIVSMVTDESRQKELLVEDEEEDFLDEGWKIIDILTYSVKSILVKCVTI
jgi:hypothetical protein